ncbi:hypothetical protein SAMN05920897_10645 [Alkalispirochaeta americana]|uniref:Uncharacterized protein n=1 Tax=Alkalispirochaeta americana TaxID=159291 RepID=A0A1N6RBZ2_9SPIO|nr:hypothetical protein [Alkalispirochaeta americana]SIQ26353.1 hypothetical protein SAMN05920897_10645 [Alkalispirochaeta americana]
MAEGKVTLRRLFRPGSFVRRPFAGILLVWCLFAGAGGVPVGLGAEEAPPPFRAPRVPARQETLDLFVRELQGGSLRGETVRVVRYGQAGTLVRPGVLELPRQGRAFSLQPYDLVAPVGRTLEIRRLPGYQGLLEASPASMVIVVSETRFELLHGRVRWIDDQGQELLLSLGETLLSGRGEVEVERNASGGDSLRIKVLRGRFELQRGAELLAVLGSGQERSLDLREDGVGTAGEDRFTRARENLEQLLEESVLRVYSGPLTGDALNTLWKAVLAFGPLYAHAEAQGVAEIPHPDEALRSLGEALRLLKAFSFRPAR